MIEFNYRKERLRTGETILRPVAKAYLFRSDNEWIAEFFYIDSGADFTLIPYRLGQFLKLEEKASKEIKEIGGVGGFIATRSVTIPMRIGDHQFECRIAWAQIEHVPFLLGREDVFDNFDIIFQQRDRKSIFKWRDE